MPAGVVTPVNLLIGSFYFLYPPDSSFDKTGVFRLFGLCYYGVGGGVGGGGAGGNGAN
ncbi:putative membrane protein [Desulfosporosinus sp. OT]|nr:putative membrane protein [Desulfosporosinus sp. OT]